MLLFLYILLIRLFYLLINEKTFNLISKDSFLISNTCNYLARKDTVTYMMIKSGITEILIDLLRHGIPARGKKPLLASLGMLAEVSTDIQTNNVKMGILAPIFDILMDTDTSLHVRFTISISFVIIY